MLNFFFTTEAGNGQFTLDTSVLPVPTYNEEYPVKYPNAVTNATFNNLFIEKVDLEAGLIGDFSLNETIIYFGDRYSNFYVELGFKVNLVNGLSPLVSIYNNNSETDLLSEYSLDTGESELTITSLKVNLPPVAQNDENFQISPNEPLNNNVLTNDSDPDKDELTSELKSNPIEGKLSFNSDGSFIYKNNDIFSGLDYFTYVAKDEYDQVSNTANVIVSIPQPEPLRIKGRYQQVAETSYDVSGDVQVGLLNKTIPFPFNPLITIKNGSLQYNLQTAIQANGVVYSNIGDIAAPLFFGNFSINKGQTTTASLEDSKLNSSTEFQLVNLDIDFTKLALQSEKIALQGTIKLPELLGGTSVDINGDNWLIIAQDGISFTGGQIKVPATSLKFANLFDFESSDLLLNYQKQPEALKIQGKAQVSIPLLRNLKSTADFSSPDKYILITADQDNGVEVDAVGTLTLLENLVIVPNKWELKQTVIDIDTPANKVSGSAGILFPFGLKVDAKLEFQQVQDGWDLNEIRVVVGTGDLPHLPGIPLVIQKLDASVTGLSDPASNLAATVHSIKITDTLSPLPTLTLPWGGSFTGSLVELELSGSIDANRLDADGNLKIAGGLITGNAHTILNWDQYTLNAGVDIQALGGILTATASLYADSALNFTMTGAGKLKTPDYDFLKNFDLAGVEIASAVVQVQFTNDANFSNDFISTGGKITGVSTVLDLLGVPAGIQVKWDGSINLLGLKEIDTITQQAEGSIPSTARLNHTNLSSLDDSILSEIAQQAWLLVQSELQKFSTSSNSILTFDIAFSSNWDRTTASAIKESWLAGDFSALPKIEIISASNISNANAAYTDSTNTIYLAQEFLTENQTNLETISGVLLEEIGHWIDAHINIADSPGDEGAIFSDLVRGKSLTAQQLQLLKAEDDTVTVTLNNTVTQLNLNSFQIAQARLNVGANTPWLLLSADWEHNIGKLEIQLQAPDGTIYTEADISDTSNIRIVEELSDETHLIIGINQPKAGIWNFKLLSNTDPGKVDFAALGGTNAPTVTITSVNQDVDSQAITINYDAVDIDSQAKISFFLDTDQNNFDGLLIAEGISETDSSGSYVLNPEEIEAGDYYIYALAEDNDSVPTFTYAPYKVKIGQSIPTTATNNSPVTDPDKLLTVNEDSASTPLDITIPTDVDGDSLTITVSSIPDVAKGAVLLLNGTAVAIDQVLTAEDLASLAFTPVANASGSVGSFSYAVSDGRGGSDLQTVALEITSVNDAPALTGTKASLTAGTEDTGYTINATELLKGFSDVDGDTLSVLNLTATNGNLVDNNNGTWSFTPTANYNGSSKLTYSVTDSNDGSTEATQSFTIAAVNDGPTVPLDGVITDPARYMSSIRDYDGNDLGSSSSWKLLGDADVQGDGDLESIFVNPSIERWATVGSIDGAVDFSNHGFAGDTRVVGIYIDPTLKDKPENIGGVFDSQRRFQNDLRIDNLSVLSADDYDKDGFQDLYFKVSDGTAVLRALMHADGNIQYANYQSQADLTSFMTANGVSSAVWDSWI